MVKVFNIQEKIKFLVDSFGDLNRELSELEKELHEIEEREKNLLAPSGVPEIRNNTWMTWESEVGKILLEISPISSGAIKVEPLSPTKLAIFYRRYLKRYKIIASLWSVVRRNAYIPLRNNLKHIFTKSKIYKIIYAKDWISLNDFEIQVLLYPSLTETPYPSTYSKTDFKYLRSPHESYEFPLVFSFVVKDAMVVGGSNLVFVNKNVICHDLYNFDQDYTSEELHGRHAIKLRSGHLTLLVQGEPTMTLAEAAVFLDACSSNYAHWISEVLPKISAFCDHNRHSDIPLVIDGGLHKNILSSLWHVVGSKRKVYQLGLGEKINISFLHMTSVAGYVPFERRTFSAEKYSHGLFSANAMKLMRQKVFSTLPLVQSDHYPSKIYISRSSNARNITNKIEIEDFLVSEGYSVVNPEALTFDEQVRLFMNANSIVASSGAALANIVFARPDVSIVIMIGIDANTSYWYWQNMACSVGCSISYVLGNPNSSGIHSDFYISKSVLSRAISRYQYV